jgi:DNA-binding MarR family transcriptional regulator
MAWKREIDQALRPLGITHTQFLVLFAAATVMADLDDAVSQQEIADEAEMDKVTTGQLVNKLNDAGLLDKNIPGLDRRMYRVIMATEGTRRLRKACTLVDEVSARLAAK